MPFDSCKFDSYFDHTDPNYTGTGRFDYSNYVPPIIIVSKLDYAKETNTNSRFISISNTSGRNMSESNTNPYILIISNDAAD